MGSAMDDYGRRMARTAARRRALSTVNTRGWFEPVNLIGQHDADAWREGGPPTGYPQPPPYGGRYAHVDDADDASGAWLED